MSKVTRQELAEIIGEKTLHLEDRSRLVNSIAAYAALQRKPIDLNSLIRDVMQYRLERGYIEAVAVSAHPLSPAVIEDVKALLREHFPGSTHIRVDSQIDEGVVGGIRIELPRETLDLSMRSKLNTFKRLVAEESR